MRSILFFVLFSTIVVSEERNFSLGIGIGSYELSKFYKIHWADPVNWERFSYIYKKEIGYDLSFNYNLKNIGFEAKYFHNSFGPYTPLILIGVARQFVKMDSLLLNFKFMPCFKNNFVYLGGGMNATYAEAKSKLETGTIIEKGTKIGFQALCGFEHNLNKYINLYLEYIYFYNTGPHSGKIYPTNLKMDIISLGMRYKF